ncbi:MAG: MFS transporter [Candidatus Heimdallarchaeaceae archaeon]
MTRMHSLYETANTKLTNSNNYGQIVLYLISSLGTAASFIARLFIELFAVIIGATPSIISLITASRNLIQQVLQPSFGRISDKIGRKTLIFFGLLSSGVILFLFPLITNGWLLLVGVIIFSLGFASYMPAFTALQGDLTKKENRAGFISLITLVGAFASLISLLIVGVIGNTGSSSFEQYAIILRTTSLLFIAASVTSLFLYEPPVKKLEKTEVFSLQPFLTNKKFRQFIWANTLMFFFMAAGWPIFPYVRSEYATAQQNTFIWSAFSICQILTLVITQKAINKIKRKTLLFLGRVLMFYIPLNLVFTVLWWPYWWIIAVGSAVSGVSNAIFLVGQNSYILDCAKEEEKGTYTGIFSLFVGISTFLGSLIMGLIADVLFKTLGKWSAIVLLLIIIAVGRFLSSLSYLLIKEP